MKPISELFENYLKKNDLEGLSKTSDIEKIIIAALPHDLKAHTKLLYIKNENLKISINCPSYITQHNTITKKIDNSLKKAGLPHYKVKITYGVTAT